MKAIQLTDEFIEWEWFSKPKTLSLYMYLMLRANEKESEQSGIQVMRGQLLTLREIILQKTGLTDSELSTAIGHLKRSNLITADKVRKFMLITILDYDKFAVNHLPPLNLQ